MSGRTQRFYLHLSMKILLAASLVICSGNVYAQPLPFSGRAGSVVRFTSSAADGLNTVTTTQTLAVAGSAGNSTGGITGGSSISCDVAADGSISGTCSETDDYGSDITLTALPATGSYVIWTGCTTDSSNTCNVTLDADTTVTASFNLNTYFVTATSAGNGSGWVSSDTGGVGYGYPAGASGTTSPINYGTEVTLTATAAAGSTVAWTACDGTVSGNGTATATCSFTALEGNETAEAEFTLDRHTLTLDTSGPGAGTVGGGGVYDYGSINDIIAAASPGSTFAGWFGDCTGSTSPLSVTMQDRDMTCTAIFLANKYGVYASVSGGHGSISCAPVSVNYGGSSVCTIVPEAGYYLWSLAANGSPVTGYMAGNTYTVPDITASMNVVAVFAAGGRALYLPRTGRTTSLAGGDDGDIQAGFPWPAQRFTDNGDGTVTDNLSSLMWAKDAGTPTVGACAGMTLNWQDALDYIACLNSNDYLGYSDWRLPDINEMESLIDAGQYAPALLSGNPFINVPVVQYSRYWSSTTALPFSTAVAWSIDIWDGGVDGSLDKSGNSLYAWPVRSNGGEIIPATGQVICYDSSGNTISCAGTGQDGDKQSGIVWPNPRFTDNEDGTVTDNLSGLMWTKDADPPGGAILWQQALDYVAAMNAGTYANYGHTDWRLPNREEIGSLADYSQQAPSLPQGHPFVNIDTQSFPYWTSTTTADGTAEAWVTGLAGDMERASSETGYAFAWPVRGGQVGDIVSAPAGDAFGSVSIGSSSLPQTFTFTNFGTVNHTLGTVSVTGADASEFIEQNDGCSNQTLAPGGACAVQVSFSPASGGPKIALLTVQTDDPLNGTMGVSLSGTAVAQGAIVINGGAPATKSRSVKLALSASDPLGKMCISNTTTCSKWTSFAAARTWTLQTGDGVKTVYVSFKDRNGNINNPMPYSSSIILDTKPPVNGTVAATAGNGQVTLNWSGFTDATSGISGYRVVYGTSPVVSCSTSAMIYNGPGTTYTHTGLTNGTRYYYRVCAIDNVGRISSGVKVKAVPIPENIPPTGSVTVNGGAAYTKSAAVTLNLTATDDSPPIIMCVSNTGKCSSWNIFSSTKTWWLSAGNGTKTVNVWFKDEWGNTDPVPYSASIILDTKPPVNGTVSAAPGSGQVTLSWSGFTDTVSGIGSYTLVYGLSTPASCRTATPIYTGIGTSYTNTGLTAGKTCYYRVCATDNAGNMSTGTVAYTKPW